MLLESKLDKFPGTITLPDADEWTLGMFEGYQKAFDKLAKKDPSRSVQIVRAFAAGQWMSAGNGDWQIEGLTLADFNGWIGKPDEANAQFVFWFARSFSEYFSKVIDPNG